jgi:hypothetical protein
MGDEHVVFLEAAFIEQDIDPLPRGQLALGVLAVDALLPAAQPRFAAPLSSSAGCPSSSMSPDFRMCLLFTASHSAHVARTRARRTGFRHPRQRSR